MMEIRASSLPLAVTCPASQVPPQTRVLTDDASARLGTAVHEAMADHIREREQDRTTYIMRYDVDPDEFYLLLALARRQWEAVKQWFPGARVEVAMARKHRGVTLEGHADLLAVVGEEVRVADWKTGWLDANHLEQLKGYCWLALGEYPTRNTAYGCILRVREGTSDGYHFTRAELDDWWQRTAATLDDPYNYRPGPQCRYCPRGHECPAKTQMLRQAAWSLTNCEAAFPDTTPAGLLDLLQRAAMVEDCAHLARELVKAEVARAGGRLDCGEGRSLELVEREQRSIIPSAAWDILLEEFTQEQLIGMAVLHKTKVEAGIAAQHRRGMKRAAVKEMLDRLERAGALGCKITQRLEVRTNGGSFNPPGADHGVRALPGEGPD